MKPAIVAMLLDARGAAVCDACVAAALGVDRGSVEPVLATLAGLSDFLRDRSRCSRCETVTSVTQALVLPRTLPAAS
jgi:hypothetical protein